MPPPRFPEVSRVADAPDVIPSCDASTITPARGMRIAWGLALVFLLVLMGSLPRLERYHGDERFYTDAALRMIETGDYLTPRYGDGSLRFKKPPLTYWALCASYRVLGVSLFSSRLPFLVAGALVIILSYRIGLCVTGRPAAAALTAGIMASNATLIELSTRSTPDVLQTLFIGLSLWGAAEILFHGRTGFRGHGLAYLGAGLAGLNKGLLALAPLAYAALYRQWESRRQPALSRATPPRLWHAGWAMTALALGLGWFLVAYLRHGGGAILSFFSDQTAQSTPGTRGFILVNLITYPVEVFRLMLPWTAVGALCLWVRARYAGLGCACSPREVRFALGWAIVLCLLFSLGTLHRTRYLLPAFPWLAAVLALWVDLAPSPADRWSRAIARGLLVIAMVIGICLGILGLGLRVSSPMGITGLAVFLASTATLWFTRKALAHTLLISSCVAILLLFGILGSVVRPVFDRSAVPRIVQTLHQLPTQSRIGSLGIPGRLIAQIRLESGARLDPDQLGTNTPPATLRTYDAILTTPACRGELEAAGFVVRRCAAEPGDWRLTHALQLLRTGNLDMARPADGVEYLLAARPPTGPQSESLLRSGRPE
jgi:4-amino-4-deoxy-L-arabinose transferase-like glycosyltransferase